MGVRKSFCCHGAKRGGRKMDVPNRAFLPPLHPFLTVALCPVRFVGGCLSGALERLEGTATVPCPRAYNHGPSGQKTHRGLGEPEMKRNDQHRCGASGRATRPSCVETMGLCAPSALISTIDPCCASKDIERVNRFGIYHRSVHQQTLS